MDIIFNELTYLEQQQVISAEQVQLAKKQYTVKPPISTQSILLTVGAILVGIGILAAITSILAYLDEVATLLILLTAIPLTFGIAIKLQTKYVKTARAFYYIGVAVVAASMYFIEDWYIGVPHFYDINLSLAIVVAILAYYLKDVLLVLFFAITIFSAMINHYEGDSIVQISSTIPYILVLIWFTLRKMQYNPWLLVSIIVLVSVWLRNLSSYFHAPVYVEVFVIFVFGIVVFFTRLSKNTNVIRWTGTIIIGVSAITLMLPDVWRSLDEPFSSISVFGFAIIFGILSFSLLRVARIEATLLIAILIMMVYLSYGSFFIPKSLFFMTFGILIIIMGYWLESTRRKTNENKEYSKEHLERIEKEKENEIGSK